MINPKHYALAKKEGRLCKNCGWIVTKKDWKAGHRCCANCRDALKGVNCFGGYLPYKDEPDDLTGEM